MKKPHVVMIGLGYIGLPTAALIASKGFHVHGVDVNEKIVNNINKGQVHIVEPYLDKIVSEVVKEGKLSASSKPVVSDNYFIVVPTPFNKELKPDISYVEDAIKSIIPLLKENDLIVIESTSPVGTTEKMKNLIISERSELKDKIFIAYCPERVLPGNILNELIGNDRVIGGINKNSTDRAISFYKSFVEGQIHSTDSKTAEMCVLVENSSRDVQISFANELSIICEKAGINVWKLIDLANKHPRVNILKPGPGVGGHCIAVDPYFIISEFSDEAKIISKAREVNNLKTDWCLEQIEDAIKLFNLQKGKIPRVALMGLSFKPNIDDLRESPAKKIVELLINKHGSDFFTIIEPNISEHYQLKIEPLSYASHCDIIIFLVAHNQFRDLTFDKDKLVIDFCGVTN